MEKPWSEEIVIFLVELQKLVLKHIADKEIPIFTEHKRGETIFRGHPNYHGEGPWRDWVLIDWGRGWGTLPSHIWCFVDLSSFKSGSKSVEYGGVRLENNVYAVVEVGQYDCPMLALVGNENYELYFNLTNSNPIKNPTHYLPPHF